MTYKDEYKKLKNLINEKLDEYIRVIYPEKIYEAMKYSVNAGGKRLRPIMTLEASRLISGNYEKAVPTACAIEMLHTQSLIHDDLPCMDNDDYRRGKLTNHKVFGEAVATLAGDALLSFAPALIIDKSQNIPSDILLKVLREFFAAAGTEGIISGQIVDIDSEGKNSNEKTLKFIHEYKTAKLFVLAVRAGALIAGADEIRFKALTDFATSFGNAFQIYDDISDYTASFDDLGKTPGKDEKAGKLTYVSMYGIEKAKNDFKELCLKSCDILKENNLKSFIFEGIIKDMEERIFK